MAPGLGPFVRMLAQAAVPLFRAFATAYQQALHNARKEGATAAKEALKPKRGAMTPTEAAEILHLPEGGALRLEERGAAVLNGHRREMADEAVSLEAQPRGRGWIGRTRRVDHAPAPTHSEVDMDDHIRHACSCKEGKEVLTDGLDA